MNVPFPAWTDSLAFAQLAPAHLAIGVTLGLVYFNALWWNARLLAAGTPMRTAAACMAGRLAMLACVLALTSFEGAAALLATALGVLIGRTVVLRRVREAAP